MSSKPILTLLTSSSHQFLTIRVTMPHYFIWKRVNERASECGDPWNTKMDQSESNESTKLGNDVVDDDDDLVIGSWKTMELTRGLLCFWFIVGGDDAVDVGLVLYCCCYYAIVVVLLLLHCWCWRCCCIMLLLQSFLLPMCWFVCSFLICHSKPRIYFRLLNSWQCLFKILPMTWFEPLTSWIGSDLFANWATTTALWFGVLVRLSCWISIGNLVGFHKLPS